MADGVGDRQYWAKRAYLPKMTKYELDEAAM